MVKWMTKIIVTEKESDNYYHFFDNRILPPQVPRPAQVTTHARWRTVLHTDVSCLSLSRLTRVYPPRTRLCTRRSTRRLQTRTAGGTSPSISLMS